MRRTLLLCCLVLFGCAKSEPPASESTPTESPATIALADVAGTWDGNITAAGSDSVLANIELTAAAEPTAWTMTVTNAHDPSMKAVVPMTSVVADGDSLVTDAGPFTSVLRAGQQVSTHAVYRLEGGQMVGTITATYPATGEVIALNSVATRRTP